MRRHRNGDIDPKRSSDRSESGGTILEAALVTPVFLLTIFCGIQAIWLSWQILALQFVAISAASNVSLGLCGDLENPRRCDRPLPPNGDIGAVITDICTDRKDFIFAATKQTARQFGIRVQDRDIKIEVLRHGFTAPEGAPCVIENEYGTGESAKNSMGLPGDTIEVSISRDLVLLGGNMKFGVQGGTMLAGFAGPIRVTRRAISVVEQFAG